MLAGVAIVSNTATTSLLDERREIAEDRFVELVVWQAPPPVRAWTHLFKYRLAFVADGLCVPRHVIEKGKGDPRHVGAVESPDNFTTPEQLYTDFMADVTNWRTRDENRDDFGVLA